MSTEDDADLPVLTQVLRTGSGQPAGSGHPEAPGQSMSAASVHQHFDVLADTDEESRWPRALVIGSDAEPHDDSRIDEPDAASAMRDPAAPRVDDLETSAGSNRALPSSIATVADPRRIDLRHNDVFLRTAPTDDAFVGRLDEPPLVAREAAHDRRGSGHTGSSGAIGHDVPLVFGDRALPGTREQEETFARQVRDSVLEELSARIDTELDARIAQTLHATLETALAHLQTGLRAELGEALRDVVGHAVDDAVRRLRRSSPFDDRP